MGEVGRIQREELGSANRSAGNESIELETPQGSLDRGQRDAKNSTELSPIAAPEQPDRKEGSGSGLSTERAGYDTHKVSYDTNKRSLSMPARFRFEAVHYAQNYAREGRWCAEASTRQATVGVLATVTAGGA